LRRLVDFDTLVIKATELLERPDAGAAVRLRWDAILVDEFQDLNSVQYRLIKGVAPDHHHLFAGWGGEQSIYSWAGAEPALFRTFPNDFHLSSIVHLEENRRCPREVFALARKLVAMNPTLFQNRVTPRADRESKFPIQALDFETDDAEA